MRACVFFAEGFEEVEALTVVDLLRRAGIQTDMVSASGTLEVTGRSGITVKTDMFLADAGAETADMLILPGGQPGVDNLKACTVLMDLVKAQAQAGTKVAAICAGPMILGGLGLVEGRHATCYPGCEGALSGATTVEDAVVVDGNIITSRGVGTAIDFALALITQLDSQEKAAEIAESIVYSA